jgi:hypothetical protein
MTTKGKYLFVIRINSAVCECEKAISALEKAHKTRGIRGHHQVLLTKPIRLLTETIGELKNASRAIEAEAKGFPVDKNLQKDDGK